ncbi:uncharacterized protein SCHCODRAFT_02588143 [Schizophyllum commune H4-8]|uniref:uncharacterized protein n=1 Tax=Schizophyllum commune (strain H4-8 / FGSC 9210) TaxID=578458 RepID=UPI00215FC395|nr:uncharacterized protein SCHCODRAFT_02588143 [Schizophyllum commune H4-8]KAI5888704.1 hypothetical protein SCHCODRAFT_02588143 [Schizophyllum commune H4-8]
MSIERTVTTLLGTSYRIVDTGIPTTNDANYLTLVFLHGWGMPCSLGITSRIAALSPSQGVRFIGVNRRGYEGSSPYTPDEAHVLQHGAPEDRGAAYRDEGRQYAHLLDALMQDGTVGAGGVAMVAWSIANAHLNATVASIHDLPDHVQERLSGRVKAFIYFEAGPRLMGLEKPPGYVPAEDKSVPPKTQLRRAQAWYAAYFKHNLASHRIDGLEMRHGDPARPPTDVVHEDFWVRYTDPDGPFPGDPAIFAPDVQPYIQAAADAALFDAGVRKAWGDPKVAYVYGDFSVWTAVWTAWALEDEWKARGSNAPELSFRVVEGGNHQCVLDLPERTLQAFLDCVT